MKTHDLPLPYLAPAPTDRHPIDCKDGPMEINHIARAAGVSMKAAKRAVEAYVSRDDNDSCGDEGGAIIEISRLAPHPLTLTRVEMAAYLARRLGIGRFGVLQRAAERAAARPEPPQEDPLTANTHPWRVGTSGRAIRTVERGHHVASLTCSCGQTKEIRFRELAGHEQIDQKFRRAGWLLDPSRCQACAHPPRSKENAVTAAATPSAAAIRSQATMFRHLGDHFDADAGRYSDGWSDEKIAKETGLSAQTVAAFRVEAFGAIKEPPEVAALAADIATFDSMLIEAAASIETMKGTQREMKQRLDQLRKKFGA